MRRMLTLVVVGLLCGCGSQSNSSGDLDDFSGVDSKTDGFGWGTPERKELMRAIHKVLDPKVNHQENGLVVSWLEERQGFVFIQATIQGRNGESLDWADSEWATLLMEGLFDGPNLAALLQKEEDTWNVLDLDVGSTDVWWVALPYRYPIPCAILPDSASFCPEVTSPGPGGQEFNAISSVIHTSFLDAELNGQPSQLDVTWFRVGGGYAFITATVLGADGTDLNWTDSVYADDVADGLFDGPNLTAFLSLDDDGWTVLEHDIGATDVSWFGAWTRNTDVPCALFPIHVCE